MAKHASNHAHPYATAFTRTGNLNMHNRKPYRTANQKAEARRTATLVDGRYVSSAPVSLHRAQKGRALP